MAHGPPIREAGSDGMRQAQPSNGLAAAADLQLLQDVVHVVLDGGGADPELTRDFFIGAALSDEREDFVFADDSGGSEAAGSGSRSNPARRLNIAAAICGAQCMRPAIASNTALWRSSALLCRGT